MATILHRTRSGKSAEDVESLSAPAAGPDGNEAEDAKASRIAANLAKLDSMPSFLSVPLMWRGYGWRFARGGNNSGIGFTHLNGVNQTPSGDSWKKWAVDGVKKKVCKVILIVTLVAAIVIVSSVLMFSAMYGWATSKDPCDVSAEMLLKMQHGPRRSSFQPDYVPVMPKIIHQQWKSDVLPEGVYSKWNQRFKELFPEPEYTHMLWTDKNAREMIANDFPFFLEAYDGYKFGIQRADAARYFFLYKYGGLYADLDYEPLINFWDHLPKDRIALVESPYKYNEVSQNSLMSSPIADPFWNTTFALLLERKNKPVLQATGPMFLDALFKKATEPYELLPCENFQRLPLHQASGEDVSPFLSRVHRELLGRLVPMKYCGNYQNLECQYGRHHNTASYLPDTGVLNLIWT